MNTGSRTQQSLQLGQASSPAEMALARTLFQEYAASLGFNLCFQNFERELAELPGGYAPPEGRLLLARVADTGLVAGCAALHRLEAGVCEMKRLYVRPEFRGRRIGWALAEAIISAGRRIGCKRMRLDTVPSVMAAAVAMYRELGFREIPPYTSNPVPGAIFMELDL
jgi:putative acetyltransferase